MKLFKQLLTRNDCYKSGRTLAPRGFMLHSTGANNPYVSRYVPGGDVIGRNTAENHWDQSNAEYFARFGVKLNKCVHAFIGKLADGSIGTVQTLPWHMRGWHAGEAEGNDQYIGVEICEDGLDDPVYFAAVWKEAVELAAMLCKMHDWDPRASGKVICHCEGHERGIASNHADVMHWFSRHGVDMDDFREAVLEELRVGERPERFDNIDQIRKHLPWAEETVRQLISDGRLRGGGKKDADGLPADMDLSLDMIRILVMLCK